MAVTFNQTSETQKSLIRTTLDKSSVSLWATSSKGSLGLFVADGGNPMLCLYAANQAVAALTLQLDADGNAILRTPKGVAKVSDLIAKLTA